MKIKPEVDPKKAWTICSLGNNRGPRKYYAKNLYTGENKPFRWSYGAAFEDIPEGERHNFIETDPEELD